MTWQSMGDESRGSNLDDDMTNFTGQKVRRAMTERKAEGDRDQWCW